MDARLAADQSNLGPGSRWRSDRVQPSASASSVDSNTLVGSSVAAASSSHADQHSTTTLTSTSVAPAPNGGAADESIAGVSQNSRTLAAKRSRLLDQLEKLADVLPADLKSSLHIKERERPGKEDVRSNGSGLRA